MPKRRAAKSAPTPAPAHPQHGLQPASFHWLRWAWLLPALIGAASFAPAPWGALVWDDKMVIGQQLNAFVWWQDALWPPEGIEQWSRAYYRPVVVLSYMLDRALFGESAMGPHAFNVLYHVLATLGLYGLLRRLLRDRPGGVGAALTGACLFAAHSIHTESVCWISGRSDVLAALFLFPAVTLALRWRDAGSWPALAGCAALSLLALLSKETAAAALVVVPASMLLAARPAGVPPPDARIWARTWTGVGLALLAAVAVTWALRDSAGVNAAPGPTAWETDPTVAPRALAWLVIKLAWPWPQSQFVSVRSLPGAAATVATAAVFAGLLAWSVVRWRRRGDGLPLLAVLWFAASVAPVVAAIVMGVAEAPVAERYLYLPSVAVALLAGVLFAAVTGRCSRNAAIAAGAVAAGLVLALAAATIERALIWRDDVSLWSDAVAKAPDEPVPLNELGAALGSRGKYDEALPLWLRARALDPAPQTASIIDSNLGLVHLERGEYGEARGYFESAVRTNWWQYNAQRGLGATLYELSAAIPPSAGTAAEIRGLLEQSRDHYDVALRVNPQAIQARLEVALVLARLGDAHGWSGDGQETVHYAQALRHLEWVFARQPAAAEVPTTRKLADSLRAAIARREEAGRRAK